MSTHKGWGHHRGPTVATAQAVDIIECEHCLFRHVVPIPHPEQLEAMYTHEFFERVQPNYLGESDADREWWHLVNTDRLALVQEHLPTTPRTLLDVGSGPGLLLEAARAQGWRAKGLEPSRTCVARSLGLGLDVVQGMFSEDTASALGTFDVVHMANVLEHVSDPTSFIRLAKSCLRPGGLLLLVVPNDFNPLQEALKAACGFPAWWVVPGQHLNYFSFESLTHLLEREAFSVISRAASFPMELFLLMGDNYIGNPPMGRALHAKRVALERNLETAGQGGTRRALYGALANVGLGREIILVARL